MKTLKNLAIGTLITLFSYLPLKSQTISGQITDLLTKQGIPNLEVIVKY